MIFMHAPKIIGGHLAPLKTPSLVHAYTNVVTTVTALVVVGYALICVIVYLGSLLFFRNCWKVGWEAEVPLLKKM